jgi:hypothetical protein
MGLAMAPRLYDGHSGVNGTQQRFEPLTGCSYHNLNLS